MSDQPNKPSLTGPIIFMWMGMCVPIIIWIPGFLWGLHLVNRGADKTVFWWNAVVSFTIYAAIIVAVVGGG